jgi:hypothetical protein
MMCGCLGWLDIPFNPANMIVLPLILGIGVDHGVHLVHLWRQQRGRFALGDATTVAVLLTASTTTASFGALILARHQGLQSLGQTLTLGVTTCLAASIVFFPALLAWLTRNRPTESIAIATVQGTSVPQVQAESASATNEAVTQGTTIAPPLVVAVTPLIDEPVASPALGEASVDLPLACAPVTDEEVAALLESAFAPRSSPILHAPSDLPAEDDDDQTSTIPRRRNLPRRSEAA